MIISVVHSQLRYDWSSVDVRVQRIRNAKRNATGMIDGIYVDRTETFENIKSYIVLILKAKITCKNLPVGEAKIAGSLLILCQ